MKSQNSDYSVFTQILPPFKGLDEKKILKKLNKPNKLNATLNKLIFLHGLNDLKMNKREKQQLSTQIYLCSRVQMRIKLKKMSISQTKGKLSSKQTHIHFRV